ncbi:PTS IIA-like nitrogen regulatory protein PtsN [Pokkaliibacter sp. CJK22405]|uniref:PTS IIA-like nitrogen regulatory protein PtsN n=1 Tax=Pokkaliibacter sp. CJK22405 TaxID=3384615 RepID=UPI003984EE0D
MQLDQILSQSCTLTGAPWSSKKRVLEQAAGLLAEHLTDIDTDDIFNGLIGRERLGSTGLGGGIAIPHCRLSQCEEVTAALIHLESPVDFDARDGQPVDIIFVLLAPEEAHESHLQALAMVAGMLQNPANVQQLRVASDSAGLYKAALSIVPDKA